jgi:hypothetical protein
MVCRASTGTAPDVGVYLQPDVGLSGYCLRSGETVLCADAQSDPRVNASAAQSLDLGSIIVMPVFAFGRLAGLLQVLWLLPNSCDSRQVTRLRHFAKVLSAELEKHQDHPKFEIAVEAMDFRKESSPSPPEILDAAQERPDSPSPRLEPQASELTAAPLAAPEPRGGPVEMAVTAARNQERDSAFGFSPAAIEARREAPLVSAEARTFDKSGFGSPSLLPAASVAVVLVVLLGAGWYFMRQRAGRLTPASPPPTARMAAVPATATAESPTAAASLGNGVPTSATTAAGATAEPPRHAIMNLAQSA